MENSQLDGDHKDVEQNEGMELVSSNEVATVELVTTPHEGMLEETPEEKPLKANEPLTVPYILNGELYEILSRNGENVTVKCCSCPSGRFYRGSVRSTGNFHMHIKRRHPYLLGKLHDMKVHSLLERRDRLMKNRKAKLRRILVNNVVTKGEHEQHKLKIKRAFQRHQAEAKGNEKASPKECSATQSQEVPVSVHTDCNKNSSFLDQPKEFQPMKPPILNSPACSLGEVCSEDACCDLGMLNLTQSTPTKNLTPTQQSTPVATPYSVSSYGGSAFTACSPTAYNNLKNESYYVESPLDLSRGTRSCSPLPNNSYESSSGIGLEPMWSNTTVANTISTGISVGELGSHNSSQSEYGDAIWWQQRLAFILRDIHNDIRARNRIEHNRLLLEVAKLKFLHPGFYFNLQD